MFPRRILCVFITRHYFLHTEIQRHPTPGPYFYMIELLYWIIAWSDGVLPATISEWRSIAVFGLHVLDPFCHGTMCHIDCRVRGIIDCFHVSSCGVKLG